MASDMYVERSIDINRRQSEVFEYLKRMRNQEEFSVWNMKDPAKKTELTGDDGTVGAVYRWDSKDRNVGAGSQEISGITKGSEIQYKLKFERPMKSVADAKFVLHEAPHEQTHVTWIFRGPTKFPMSLFKGIFQRMLGRDMARSLDNLKHKLEL